MGYCGPTQNRRFWGFFTLNNYKCKVVRRVMTGKRRKMKDGKIRSFNLSCDAIAKLVRGAEIEGLSRSAYMERLIVQNDHERRVRLDVEGGIQTTLIETPTPPKPSLTNRLCSTCWVPLADHLEFDAELNKWTAKCPRTVVE